MKHWLLARLLAGIVGAAWIPAAGARQSQPARCAAPSQELLAAVGDGGCSVLLIAQDKVLTAAHCADPRRYQLSGVTLSRGAHRERIAVMGCTPHPRFDGLHADFDLAVCQLERKVAAVQPIELSAVEPPVPTDLVCVLGFRGKTNDRSRQTLPGRVRQLPSARTVRLELKTCAGDSGSPVFLPRRGGWQAFALVSGGEAASGTCSDVTTGTRLAPALEWIRAQAQIP